jgi:hypothetical protein
MTRKPVLSKEEFIDFQPTAYGRHDLAQFVAYLANRSSSKKNFGNYQRNYAFLGAGNGQIEFPLSSSDAKKDEQFVIVAKGAENGQRKAFVIDEVFLRVGNKVMTQDSKSRDNTEFLSNLIAGYNESCRKFFAGLAEGSHEEFLLARDALEQNLLNVAGKIITNYPKKFEEAGNLMECYREFSKIVSQHQSPVGAVPARPLDEGKSDNPMAAYNLREKQAMAERARAVASQSVQVVSVQPSQPAPRTNVTPNAGGSSLGGGPNQNAR